MGEGITGTGDGVDVVVGGRAPPLVIFSKFEMCKASDGGSVCTGFCASQFGLAFEEGEGRGGTCSKIIIINQT